MANQPEETEEDKKRKHRRKIALITLGGLFLFIGLIWLLYWLIWGRFEVYTDDAYVNGNMVQLNSQISGNITDVYTDDTLLVKKGQILIKFDPADTVVALQQAQAALAETVRQVRQTYENAQRQQALLFLRKADLIKAELDVKRREGLVGNSAVSREEYQHYQTSQENAQAEYNATLHDLRSALAIIENTHLYTNPIVERAKANFKNAYLNAQRAVVLAPVTGYIAKRSAQVGQHVSVNTPMLAVIPLDQIWVDANYKESQLNGLRIGQPVILYADAYPGVTYHGKIFGLNLGTGAAFALLPPQNATGNWIKIVQRLPVRIALDPDEIKKHPLQLGLSMRVTTNIHNLNGPRLSQVIEEKPVYFTNIYAQQIANANKIIDSILKNNSPDINLKVAHNG